ncbi:MAG TPA: Gfo/Idh/MocA family oxidoreductase, partial [Acidimicrobiales bacterium]|nr:Gfo/Idh/MocA family oxidoreductase [Acidimicrobiales bacterium]
MIELFAPVAEACAISVPEELRLPVALVGAGAIADVAHLPSYRKAGLEVVGILDVNRERAGEVAARHGIGRVYADLDELLGDEAVAVVDVAVPASAQPAICRRVIDSGRHMLGQKPFAPSSALARELAELAESRGVVLAVNQQLRYDEGIAAAHAMANLGWLGELTHLEIAVDIWTEWASWPWMLDLDELEVWNHSIHYHDAVRYFLGEPSRVFSIGGRTPGQRPQGETRTLTTYCFESGATASVSAHHLNRWGDPSAVFRLEGSLGALRGSLGLLYDYPRGRPDTLALRSDVVPTDGWLPYPVTSRWIPDAFLGP